MADLASAAAAPTRRRSKRSLRHVPISIWICAFWCAMVVLLAVFANFLPLWNPDTPDYKDIAGPPSPEHWLGTDQLGRDMLSRLIYGARASLQIGFFAVLLGMTVGVVLGLLAGHLRGWVDTLITGAADIVLAFPTLIFIMVLVAVRGASAGVLIFGLAVVMVPTFTRLARANSLVWSRRDFVTASKVLGARQVRSMFRDILPNVLPALIAYSFVVVAVIMVAEGSLSFLGFGVQPPTPSWGSMIAGGRQMLSTAPHIVMFPALALFLTVLSFNLIGDYLRARSAVGRSDVSL